MADYFLGVLLFAFSRRHPSRPSVPQGNTKVSHKKIKSNLNKEPAEIHREAKRKRGHFWIKLIYFRIGIAADERRWVGSMWGLRKEVFHFCRSFSICFTEKHVGSSWFGGIFSWFSLLCASNADRFVWFWFLPERSALEHFIIRHICCQFLLYWQVKTQKIGHLDVHSRFGLLDRSFFSPQWRHLLTKLLERQDCVWIYHCSDLTLCSGAGISSISHISQWIIPHSGGRHGL